MTKKALMEQVMAGTDLKVATYLKGSLKEIRMRDGANPGGPRRVGYVTNETCVTTEEPVVVSRFLMDNEKSTEWKPSAKGGDKVVIIVEKKDLVQGIPVIRGRIEALTD